jgi:tRNA (Thr-GGU) A37 N-methylase
LLVRGMDCLDGAPLLDIKPDRTLFTPIRTAAAWRFRNGLARTR